MPVDNIILGLRDYKIRGFAGGNPVLVELEYTGRCTAHTAKVIFFGRRSATFGG